MPRRNLATQKTAAERYGISDRTIRNYISRGIIRGYRLPGGRAIRVDLDELDAALTEIPAVQADHSGRVGA